MQVHLNKAWEIDGERRYIRFEMREFLFLNDFVEEHFSLAPLIYMLKSIIYWVYHYSSLLQKIIKIWRIALCSSFHEACNWEVRLMKASSLHGIVRPPIGWLNPNSSSARVSRSWNEGWFKYDMGTTNRFLWISPTYTAMCPLGTSDWFLVWMECSLRSCLALAIMDSIRTPMTNTKLVSENKYWVYLDEIWLI